MVQGDDTFSSQHKVLYLLLNSSSKGIASAVGTRFICAAALLFTLEIEEVPRRSVNGNIQENVFLWERAIFCL